MIHGTDSAHRLPGLAIRSIAGLVLAAATLVGCSNGSGGTGDAPPVAKETPATPAPATPTPAETEAARAAKIAQKEAMAAAAAAAKETVPAPVIVPAGEDDFPVITFERISHEFGTIPDTSKVRTTFAFTNTGNGRLVIDTVKGSCGCTVPSLSRKEFMPGEGDEIAVVFDPKGRPGRQSKTVSVTSNSRPEGNHTLRFVAQVEPLLTLKERFVRLDKLPIGVEFKKTLEATYADPELAFTSITVNQPWATARLVESGVPIDEDDGTTRYGATFELTIGEDAPWGTIYSTRMKIGVSAKPDPEAAPVTFEYEVFLQGQIYGEIEASTRVGSRASTGSSILSLGRVDQGNLLRKTVMLRRVSQEPFEILNTHIQETTMDGVEVTATRLNDHTWEVAVQAINATRKGLVRGMVIVTTDVEGEEELPIRFTGSFK